MTSRPTDSRAPQPRAPQFELLSQFVEHAPDAMSRRATEFLEELSRRRSVRQFSNRPIPPGIVQTCIRTAATAPSGANLQPWTFVAISDPALKNQIRDAAEAEERRFYQERAPQEWLDALAPLGTDASKPYLDTAPCLIAIFVQTHRITPEGARINHYYATESVGIATGFLIAALHHAGLATLTHTPSPMGFLNRILKRPASEKPFLLLVTGFPSPDARVPVITKKPLDAVACFR